MDDVKVSRAIFRTWETIASDAMPEEIEEELTNEEYDEIKVEVTLDANRLEMYGGEDEAVAEFRKLPFEAQDAFARQVFRMPPRNG